MINVSCIFVFISDTEILGVKIQSKESVPTPKKEYPPMKVGEINDGELYLLTQETKYSNVILRTGGLPTLRLYLLTYEHSHCCLISSGLL